MFASNAKVFAFRLASGRLRYLPKAVPIGDNLYSLIKSDKQVLDDNIRFTSKCRTNGCKQWDSNVNMCKVANYAKSLSDKLANISVDVYSDCSIRSTCRWYSNHGLSVCKSCTILTRSEIT